MNPEEATFPMQRTFRCGEDLWAGMHPAAKATLKGMVLMVQVGANLAGVGIRLL